MSAPGECLKASISHCGVIINHQYVDSSFQKLLPVLLLKTFYEIIIDGFVKRPFVNDFELFSQDAHEVNKMDFL